jgi:nucleolar MIF4G domain-containing protein 1
LQYFLQEKVKTSDITTGKKQKQRVAWGVDAMFDIIDEFLKDSEE